MELRLVLQLKPHKLKFNHNLFVRSTFCDLSHTFNEISLILIRNISIFSQCPRVPTWLTFWHWKEKEDTCVYGGEDGGLNRVPYCGAIMIDFLKRGACVRTKISRLVGWMDIFFTPPVYSSPAVLIIVLGCALGSRTHYPHALPSIILCKDSAYGQLRQGGTLANKGLFSSVVKRQSWAALSTILYRP